MVRQKRSRVVPLKSASTGECRGALLWPDLTLERVRAGLDDPGLVREALTAADPQAARRIYGGE